MTDRGYKMGRQLPAGTLVGGRYRVGELLGRGGMGAVYEAEHVELGRTVALKTLLPQAVEAQTAERLIQEARAAARIGHPGIVDVFDLVEEDGIGFVIMERLRGEDLHDRIKRTGPLPVELVLRMGIDIASAIAAAHAHGIVHRDLKPRNVFIAEDPRIGEVFKVLDFGIAKWTQDVDLRLVTDSGHVIGTPAYMAPERLAGERQSDGLADLYAIGAVMYEALVGAPPFEASSYPELVLRISSERPRPLAERRSGVPVALAQAIERALAKDPQARQSSVAVFAEELALINLDSAVTPMAEPVEVDTATVRRLPVSATGPKRRAYRWAAAAAALLGVLGASAVAALLSRASEPAHARTTVASAQPLPEARAEAVAALAPVREAEPERQPAPALRRVRIESRPSGAGIAIDGRRQCTAPCELELPQRPVEVEAKLPGHVAARKRLSAPLPDRLAFDLTPKRPQPRGVERPDPGLPPLLPR